MISEYEVGDVLAEERNGFGEGLVATSASADVHFLAVAESPAILMVGEGTKAIGDRVESSLL